MSAAQADFADIKSPFDGGEAERYHDEDGLWCKLKVDVVGGDPLECYTELTGGGKKALKGYDGKVTLKNGQSIIPLNREMRGLDQTWMQIGEGITRVTEGDNKEALRVHHCIKIKVQYEANPNEPDERGAPKQLPGMPDAKIIYDEQTMVQVYALKVWSNVKDKNGKTCMRPEQPKLTVYEGLRRMENVLRWFDIGMFFFACLGVVLAAWELDLLWNEDHYEPTAFTWFVKSLITCTTMILLLLIWLYYDLLFKWSKLRGTALPKDTMWSTGILSEALSLMLLCAIHPFPFVYFDIPVGSIDGVTHKVSTYSSDSMLALCMLTRIVLIFRLLRDHCGVITDSARVFASINQVRLDTWFCLKYIFHKKPVYTLGCTLLIFMFGLAFCMREFEKPVNESLRSYSNCCWLMLVTMTTVGYGDIYPITLMGRVTAIAACIIGIVLISMAVVAIGKSFDMRGTKKTAMARIVRASYHGSYRDSSSQLITRFFRAMNTAGYQPCRKYNDFVDLYVQRELKDNKDRPKIVKQARREWESLYKVTQAAKKPNERLQRPGHPGILDAFHTRSDSKASPYDLDARPPRGEQATGKSDALTQYLLAREGEAKEGGDSGNALIYAGQGANGTNAQRRNALHFYRQIDTAFCEAVRLQRRIKQVKAVNEMTDLNFILCQGQSKLIFAQDKIVEMHYRWQEKLNKVCTKLGLSEDHTGEVRGKYVRGRRQSMAT